MNTESTTATVETSSVRTKDAGLDAFVDGLDQAAAASLAIQLLERHHHTSLVWTAADLAEAFMDRTGRAGTADELEALAPEFYNQFEWISEEIHSALKDAIDNIKELELDAD